MDQYRSHKVVEAGEIQVGQVNADGTSRWIVGSLGSTEIVEAPPGFVARGTPTEGDFLVRYSDGYLSWSPRQAFLDGYRPIAADEGHGRNMTFGLAIERLKDGNKVARRGWNGKGMWLALSGPLQGREIAFENFWSKPCSEHARQNGGSAVVLPCINMKTAGGEILMGWLASQSDMLAEDWEVVA